MQTLSLRGRSQSRPSPTRSTLKLGNHLANTAEIAGGGAPAEVAAPDEALVSETPAPFGVHGFKASAYDTHGNVYTTAGGHPYQATTGFFFNTHDHLNQESDTERGIIDSEVATSGNLKDADVQLPEGFVGDPNGRPKCSQDDFARFAKGNEGSIEGRYCPENSQVGTVVVFDKFFEHQPETLPVYNLEPPTGQVGTPAEFGFIFGGVPVRLDAHLRKVDGQYQVTVLCPGYKRDPQHHGRLADAVGHPCRSVAQRRALPRISVWPRSDVDRISSQAVPHEPDVLPFGA